MYTLYYGRGAASLAIHAALVEIGAQYELVEIDLEAGQQRSPEYLRINPQGKVTTLVVEGKPWHESRRSSNASNRCGRHWMSAWPIMAPICWASIFPART